MFNTSPKTLQKSLHNLLNCAQDYVSDVCIDYPTEKIWAHRAILLARVPKRFRQQYMAALDRSLADSGEAFIILKPVLPQPVLIALLRFWYTAEFAPSELADSVDEADRGSSSRLPPSPRAKLPSTAMTSVIHHNDAIVQRTLEEIHQYEKQLGMPLLPISTENTTDLEQLVADLNLLWQTGLGSDVTVSLISGPHTDVASTISFSCHRCILASRSHYFHHMFCDDFVESSKPTVELTSGVFTPDSLQAIFSYFYTDKLVVSNLPVDLEDKPATQAQKMLRDKMHALRVLHTAFQAADFLGPNVTMRRSVLYEMGAICHSFTCDCSDCALILPFMLCFADDQTNAIYSVREVLITQYSDVLSPALWASRTFATLVKARPGLIHEILSRILTNANKHTAIHVIPLVHACISLLYSVDPALSWSRPTVEVLNQIVHHCVTVVADNFEFYCGVYPVLLSCVDGIKGDFSLDSLEFLLKRVLTDGIHEANAGNLYRGIAYHLLGRHSMDRNSEVHIVLLSAREKCIQYLKKHWPAVKAQGGFRGLDKDTLRELSEDLNLPLRALTKKSFDSHLTTLFRFRTKSIPKPKNPLSDKRSRPISILSYRRLSFRSQCSLSSNMELSSEDRVRRLSADDALQILRKEAFSTSFGMDDSNNLTADDHSPLNNAAEIDLSSDFSLLDQLLPPDMWRSYYPNSVSPPLQQPITSPLPSTVSVKPIASTSTNTTTGRPQRITFELPVTPQRVNPPSAKHALPSNKLKRSRSPLSYYRQKLTQNSNSSSENSDSDEDRLPAIGTKVELLRRPLPTHGTIKFVGPVHFAKGTWVGVELESRLGNNDGAVDGIRYFYTNHQRGAFCKLDDFKIVSLPGKAR